MHLRAAVALVVALALLSHAVHAFDVSSFIGTWIGTPSTSVVGPLLHPAIFVVEPITEDIFIMYDTLLLEADAPSWQKFFVSDDTLLYCGYLNGFFSNSSTPGAPIERWSTLQADSNATYMHWCDATRGCAEVDWRIVLASSNTLQFTSYVRFPVVHVNVTFVREAASSTVARPSSARASLPPPMPDGSFPFSCRFPNASAASAASPLAAGRAAGCPFARAHSARNLHHKASHGDEVVAAAAAAAAAAASDTVPTRATPSRSFCYRLNDVLNVTLAWTMNYAQQQLDAVISCNAGPTDWVALGFQPQFPGMNMSDIALGYVQPSNGEPCVRSMRAVKYVGTPVDQTAMVLSDTSAWHANGRTSVSFSRSFSTGNYPIPVWEPGYPNDSPFVIIWATGPTPPEANCTVSPHYHGSHRGVAIINWSQPSAAFDASLMC